MKVTKFEQCCLLIEDNGLRILTDPESYSTAQNEVKHIDVILNARGIRFLVLEEGKETGL